MSVSPVNFKRIPEEYGRSFKEFVSDAYLHAGNRPAINVKISLNKVEALNLDTFETRKAEFDNNGNMTNLKIYKAPRKNIVSAINHPELYRQYFYLGGSRVPSTAIEYDGYEEKIKEVTIYNTRNHRTQPKHRDDNFQYDERKYANVGTQEYKLEPLNDGSSVKVWRKSRLCNTGLE